MKLLALFATPSIFLLLSHSAPGLPQAIRRGPFSVNSNALSLTASSGGADELRFKYAGDQTAPPGVPAFPASYMGPNYDLQAMFPLHYDYVDLDAISTGNDLLPVNALGQIDPTTGWAAMVFSVTNSAIGSPGGWIDRRVTIGDSTPGADLVSYMFEGSTGIAGGVVGETFIEQTREHIGLSGDQDIDALDWFMVALAANGGVASNVLFTNANEVYFSVTTDSAAVLDTVGEFWGSIPASGATVLKIIWDPATAMWSSPGVVYKPSQLNLSVAGEVDAIAYNVNTGTLIFSTEFDPGAPNRPQLEVTSPTGVMELKRKTGESIGDAIKIRPTDDVDAVCGLDPEALQYSTWLSTSVLYGSSTTLGMSVARAGTASNPLSADQVVVQVTGLSRFIASDESRLEIFYTIDLGAVEVSLGTFSLQPGVDSFELRGPAPPGAPGAAAYDVAFYARVTGTSYPGISGTGYHMIKL